MMINSMGLPGHSQQSVKDMPNQPIIRFGAMRRSIIQNPIVGTSIKLTTGGAGTVAARVADAMLQSDIPAWGYVAIALMTLSGADFTLETIKARQRERMAVEAKVRKLENKKNKKTWRYDEPFKRLAPLPLDLMFVHKLHRGRHSALIWLNDKMAKCLADAPNDVQNEVAQSLYFLLKKSREHNADSAPLRRGYEDIFVGRMEQGRNPYEILESTQFDEDLAKEHGRHRDLVAYGRKIMESVSGLPGEKQRQVAMLLAEVLEHSRNYHRDRGREQIGVLKSIKGLF